MEDNRNIEIHNGKAVVKNKERGLNDAEGRAMILALFGKTAKPKNASVHKKTNSSGKNSWDKAVNKAIAEQNAAMQRIAEERKAQEAERKRKEAERKAKEELRQKQKAEQEAQRKAKELKQQQKKQKQKAKRKAKGRAKRRKMTSPLTTHASSRGSTSSSPYRGMMASSNWNTAKSWWPYRN